MARVKAYYDLTLLFGLTDEQSFYSYPVEVSANAVAQAKSLRTLLNAVAGLVPAKSMPQDAQEMADFIEGELAYLMKTQKRRAKNVSIDDTEQSD